MNLELQNRVVLITGGAAGIGEATVRAFAAEGAIVWFADRNADRGRALAAEVPRSVFAEGDLADPDETKRNEAVENHKKWVDAAQKLGCHSIRVNTFGTNDPEVWKVTVVDGLKKLSEYAATKGINVLCENHGWLSSDVPKLLEAIQLVNMSNCGTLPDFGNWCVKRKEGAQWGECLEVYPDKYQGIKMMLTAAKAVSAKSYDFDENGNETTLDYPRILQLVKDSGYTNFIGVEYEGTRLSEREGILATKNLLLNSVASLK